VLLPLLTCGIHRLDDCASQREILESGARHRPLFVSAAGIVVFKGGKFERGISCQQLTRTHHPERRGAALDRLRPQSMKTTITRSGRNAWNDPETLSTAAC